MRIPTPVVFVLLTASLAAQDADPGQAVVRGRILDSRTGAPVSGATAHLFSGGQEGGFLVESDGEGRFRLPAVPPDVYHATILRSGYQVARGGPYSITAGDDVQEITLELDPSAVIAGRVLDHRGRPVVAAMVTAYQLDAHPVTLEPFWNSLRIGSSYAFTPFTGVSNDRGEYRLWGLPEGRYVLLAKPAPRPAPDGVLRFDAAPAFYPNADSFDQAARLDLTPGEVREAVDIPLGAPAETQQSFRVSGDDGPCSRCAAGLYRKGDGADIQIVSSVVLSADGELVVEGLPPGEYVAGVRARGRRGPYAQALQEFVVGSEGDRPFSFAVQTPAPIRGKVVFVDPPESLPEAPESPFPRYNVASVTPRAADREKLWFSCTGEGGAIHGEGEERSFEVVAAPGRCLLVVTGPPESHVLGMELDGVPLERPEIHIPPGGVTEGLTVRIGFDAGEVRGRIEDGGLGFQAFLLPDDGSAFARYQQTEVGADGSFRARVPPGEWKVLVAPLPHDFAAGGILPRLAAAAGRGRRAVVKAGQTTVLAEPLPVVD